MTRRLSWIIGACSAALCLAVAWPLFFRLMSPLSDIGGFHIPMRHLYQQALRSGDSLLWTSALFAGYYVQGEGQIGPFHPLHQVLYRLLPLDVAVNLEVLATYAWAFAGMYWFLRRLRLSTSASLLGAMVFAFSGFQLLHYPHVNVVAVVAHMPWLLACLDLVVAGERPVERAAGYAGVALTVASELLLGFPQAVWWNILAAVPFAFWRAREAGHMRRLFPSALAILTGMLLGGIQLLPTFDVAMDSIRGQLPRSFFLGYSLHPWNVVQLFSPYALAGRAFSQTDPNQLHEFGIYPGAFLTIAPLWLWVRRRELAPRRTLIVGASWFAVLMFILALGRYGGLDILLTYVPGIGSLRAPARYIVLVQFVLAIFAAIAFDDLAALRPGGFRLRRAQIAQLGAVAAISVLTTLLLNTRSLPVRPELAISPVSRALVGTAVVIAVTATLLLAARRITLALPLLVVLTAVDLGFWGVWPIYRQRPQPVEWFTGGIPPAPIDRPARVVAPLGWANRLLMKNYDLVAGYVGLYPRTRLSWEYGTTFQRLAGARVQFDTEARKTLLTDSAPRARLLVDVRVTDDVVRDIEGIDLLRAALVDQPVMPLSGVPGTARVVLDRPGQLIVETSASGRQLLSVSERFHPGWSASEEGRALHTLAVNGDFLGVVLEPGTHRVELHFMPRSFVLGVVASGAGVVALLVGVALLRSRPRRSAGPG